jgi:hypothetical protein
VVREQTEHHQAFEIRQFYETAMKENIVPGLVHGWRTMSLENRRRIVISAFQVVEHITVMLSGRMLFVPFALLFRSPPFNSRFLTHRAPEITLEYLSEGCGYWELLDWLIESAVRFPKGKGYLEIVNPIYDQNAGISRNHTSPDRSSRSDNFSQAGNIRGALPFPSAMPVALFL